MGLAFASILLTGFSSQKYADMAIINGNIYTVNPDNPHAQALAVKDSKIIAIGSGADIKKYIGPDTRTLDVESNLVIPGFIDAHCHFTSGGRSLTMLDISGARSVQQIQALIARQIKDSAPGAPIIGVGSFPNTGLFPGLGWPRKEILDHVAPDNPVIINRGGGHAVWVNSVTLKQSKISKDTKVPEGGEIVLDEDTGEPTGILIEAAAGLVRIKQDYTPKEYIEKALKHAAQFGLTGVCTASQLSEHKIYQELNQQGKLTLRVYAWLPIQGLDDYIKHGIKQTQGDEMVKVGFLKCFLDGTIGVRSALMFEDFTEEPGNRGLPQYAEEDFYALIDKAHENGYQTGVHAIGDKAVNWVLNAVERAQQKHGKKGLRHRIEHATVCLVEDTKRVQELGMVASMQPSITGPQAYRERRLGKERARRVDMWRTLLDNKADLAWGTDWPVSSLNPMVNIYNIVTRYPEQRLTMAEAIKYYTYGSAYSAFQEDVLGTLEVGKFADMVVLSQDLFNIEPRKIMGTRVLYTIVGGKIVFKR